MLTRWMLIVLLALSTAAARAQSISADEMLARELQRVALMDLRLVDSPDHSDFEVAGVLLEMAGEWMPGDVELLRRRIEVAQAARQPEVVEELTDALLRLDPDDTTAQLRAIASRIRRLNTLGDRLAQYQKLVEAGSIDASVRSRLALDMALLHRERGDDEAFARSLAESMRLDATNKQAVMLAWTRYGPTLDDERRFELLLNLLYADPLDAAVHRLVALELLASGSFERARRFHNNALNLTRDAFGTVPEWLMNEALVLEWYIEGPEVVLDRLNDDLNRRRSAAAAAIQQAEAAGLPTATMEKPEDVRLTPTFGRERIIAAWLVGDDATRIAAAQDLRTDIEDWTDELEDPRKRPAGVPAVELARQVALETAEVWAFAAWADSAPQLIEVQLSVLGPRVGEDHASFRRLAAYRELRLGNLDAAIPTIEELLEFGYVIDEAALALAYQRRGDIEDAERLYRGIVDRMPLRAVGAWARHRLMGLDQPDIFASPNRRGIERLADAIPRWMDTMIREPSSIVRFRADLLDTGPADPMTPAKIKLRIENIANIPLGVGDGRTIVGTVMLTPKIVVGTREEFTLAQPEVVLMNQRLRLKPGEAIETVVTADPGLAGWTIAAGSRSTVRASWRAMHGFSIGANDGIARTSSTGLESSTSTSIWSLLPESGDPFIELVDRAESEPVASLPSLLAGVRAQLVSSARAETAGETASVAPDQAARLGVILAQRLGSLPKREQLLTLAILPHAGLVPALQPLDEAALASTDPDVAALALVTRVRTPEHPALSRWADMDEPSHATAMAQALLTARALGRDGGVAQAVEEFESLAPERNLLLASEP